MALVSLFAAVKDVHIFSNCSNEKLSMEEDAVELLVPLLIILPDGTDNESLRINAHEIDGQRNKV
jgi:hypothetical protein